MRCRTCLVIIFMLFFLVSGQYVYSEKKVVTLDDLKNRFDDKDEDSKGASGSDALTISSISKKVEPGESNRVYVKFRIRAKGWHEVKLRVATLDSEMKVVEVLDNGAADDKVVSGSWINGNQLKGGHTYAFEFPYTKNYKYAVAEITFGEREEKKVIKKASTSKVNVEEITIPEAGGGPGE
ncbi:MAG: hypothetical protein JW728_07150 [Candidatus Aureabacteria bacterium]|nr:hypothetical protein [Candidatus Auribacterota bacterium]